MMLHWINKKHDGMKIKEKTISVVVNKSRKAVQYIIDQPDDVNFGHDIAFSSPLDYQTNDLVRKRLGVKNPKAQKDEIQAHKPKPIEGKHGKRKASRGHFLSTENAL